MLDAGGVDDGDKAEISDILGGEARRFGSVERDCRTSRAWLAGLTAVAFQTASAGEALRSWWADIAALTSLAGLARHTLRTLPTFGSNNGADDFLAAIRVGENEAAFVVDQARYDGTASDAVATVTASVTAFTGGAARTFWTDLTGGADGAGLAAGTLDTLGAGVTTLATRAYLAGLTTRANGAINTGGALFAARTGFAALADRANLAMLAGGTGQPIVASGALWTCRADIALWSG
ncbi:hypothetical protein C8D77_101221 [Mesorhizobium loti]|uniref:Uncharacterized protein n=1 Tax=Rhizobium loti TaxID=381 RepID=A0A8E2WGI1_RHILI|nr:hypothetical protein C8D77_101221 [Mesorhizobium loti]